MNYTNHTIQSVGNDTALAHWKRINTNGEQGTPPNDTTVFVIWADDKDNDDKDNDNKDNTDNDNDEEDGGDGDDDGAKDKGNL